MFFDMGERENVLRIAYYVTGRSSTAGADPHSSTPARQVARGPSAPAWQFEKGESKRITAESRSIKVNQSGGSRFIRVHTSRYDP